MTAVAECGLDIGQGVIALCSIDIDGQVISPHFRELRTIVRLLRTIAGLLSTIVGLLSPHQRIAPLSLSFQIILNFLWV